MRIALFHNRYRERGGEDRAVDAQCALLGKAGHDVRLFAVDNRDELRGVAGGLRAVASARWNRGISRRIAGFLDDFTPDVAHVHNFFPVLSPALHHALADRGIPVVQTLHNYRLVCASAMLMRDGEPCEECVLQGPWHAVRYGCYRGSRVQTAVWADATAHHRRLGTWHTCVSAFTAPGTFARRKLVEAGLPAERTSVLPNLVSDPGPPTPPGEGAVFLGRLSPEKGVDLLIDAWRELPDVPLVIAGSGPEEARLRARAAGLAHVRFAGALPPDRALAALRAAAFVVVPSRWYEVFPMVVLEAMACGRAVVVPHPTALSEIVDPGAAGLHFERGDAASLARACLRLAGDPELAQALGEEARATYECEYAPPRVLARLEALYASVSREPT